MLFGFNGERIAAFEINREVTAVLIHFSENRDLGQAVLEEGSAGGDDVEGNPTDENERIVLRSVVEADEGALGEVVQERPGFFVRASNLNVRAKQSLQFEGVVAECCVVFCGFVLGFAENDAGDEVDDFATETGRDDGPDHDEDEPTTHQEGRGDTEAAENPDDRENTQRPSESKVVDPPENRRICVANFDAKKRLKRINHI